MSMCYSMPSRFKIEFSEETEHVVWGSYLHAFPQYNKNEYQYLEPLQISEDALEEITMKYQAYKKENILPFIMDELNITQSDLPFVLESSPTFYATFWDTENKVVKQEGVETRSYKLKNLVLPKDFIEIYDVLNDIQKQQFLNDILDMIVKCEFKYVYNVTTIPIINGAREMILLIRGILKEDYDRAAANPIKDNQVV